MTMTPFYRSTRPRFHVSLNKNPVLCDFCNAKGVPSTRMLTAGSYGYTWWSFWHSQWCRTRLFGAQVPAGAPFAPGEHTNDRRAS